MNSSNPSPRQSGNRDARFAFQDLRAVLESAALDGILLRVEGEAPEPLAEKNELPVRWNESLAVYAGDKDAASELPIFFGANFAALVSLFSDMGREELVPALIEHVWPNRDAALRVIEVVKRENSWGFDRLPHPATLAPIWKLLEDAVHSYGTVALPLVRLFGAELLAEGEKRSEFIRRLRGISSFGGSSEFDAALRLWQPDPGFERLLLSAFVGPLRMFVLRDADSGHLIANQRTYAALIKRFDYDLPGLIKLHGSSVAERVSEFDRMLDTEAQATGITVSEKHRVKLYAIVRDGDELARAFRYMRECEDKFEVSSTAALQGIRGALLVPDHEATARFTTLSSHLRVTDQLPAARTILNNFPWHETEEERRLADRILTTDRSPDSALMILNSLPKDLDRRFVEETFDRFGFVGLTAMRGLNAEKLKAGAESIPSIIRQLGWLAGETLQRLSAGSLERTEELTDLSNRYQAALWGLVHQLGDRVFEEEASLKDDLLGVRVRALGGTPCALAEIPLSVLLSARGDHLLATFGEASGFIYGRWKDEIFSERMRPLWDIAPLLREKNGIVHLHRYIPRQADGEPIDLSVLREQLEQPLPHDGRSHIILGTAHFDWNGALEQESMLKARAELAALGFHVTLIEFSSPDQLLALCDVITASGLFPADATALLGHSRNMYLQCGFPSDYGGLLRDDYSRLHAGRAGTIRQLLSHVKTGGHYILDGCNTAQVNGAQPVLTHSFAAEAAERSITVTGRRVMGAASSLQFSRTAEGGLIVLPPMTDFDETVQIGSRRKPVADGVS